MIETTGNSVPPLDNVQKSIDEISARIDKLPKYPDQSTPPPPAQERSSAQDLKDLIKSHPVIVAGIALAATVLLVLLVVVIVRRRRR